MKTAVFLLLASLSCCMADECGRRRRAENNTVLITGGSEALPHEFPWQVAILVGDQLGCGGSIVDENWIVTAAHCAIYPQYLYTILVGKHNWNKDEEGQQSFDVSEILIHPFYWGGKLNFDVALMKLSGTLDFEENANIGPVCLPEQENEFTGQMCTTSGWGFTSPDNATPSNVLQKVDLPVLSNRKCEQMLGIPWTVPDSMVCAGNATGKKGPCKGDSGGPLVCQRQDGKWVLAGITSSGLGNCGGYGSSSIFTSVPYVIEWIETKTRHHG